MEVLRKALLLMASLLVACGSDGDPNQAPKRIRACGELEGVTAVEPAVIGEHPLQNGIEGSCPIFEPVPCTSSREEYASLCGPHCWPATATRQNGDEWLIGCEYSLMTPCADLDYTPKPRCYVDPYAGERYWHTYPGCPSVLEALFCFTPCEPQPNWPDPPDFCPDV